MAKGDANWWLGENSIWGQIRPDEISFMGAEASWGEDGKSMFDFSNFSVPTEIDLSPDLKFGLMIVGVLIVFKIIMK